jgi:TetR/AcrR family transcriptional regulator, lmrAB and yxaGH operons repressor
MERGVRERMVDSAIVLLAKHSLAGTSFADVIAASGAPRGSIYHHFPDGKAQLIAAAVEVAGQRAIVLVETLRGQPPADIVDGFMMMWRSVLDRSNFSAGCSVLAVTVSADSRDLLDRAAAAFRSWRDRIADLLVAGGVNATSATSFATLLIASSEGAVVLSRAEQSFALFDAVHEQLRAYASSLR